jgi:cytochrome c biogenesis protein CcdA
VLVVAGIGLADSLNPSTIGPALLYAVRSHRPFQLLAFTAGVFLTSFAAGAVIVAGPGQLLVDKIPHLSAHTKALGEVGLGVALVILSAVLWHFRGHVSRTIAKEPGSGLRGAFTLGVGVILVELPTAVPYFGALAVISGSKKSLPTQLGLVVVFNVAFVLPLVLIALAQAFGGSNAARFLMWTRGFVNRAGAAVLAVAIGAIGVGLIAFGGYGLLQ